MSPIVVMKKAIRKRPFVKMEYVECPIEGCKTKIKPARDLKRHVTQIHGELMDDGSYGKKRWLYKQTGCTTLIVHVPTISVFIIAPITISCPKKMEIVFDALEEPLKFKSGHESFFD